MKIFLNSQKNLYKINTPAWYQEYIEHLPEW